MGTRRSTRGVGLLGIAIAAGCYTGASSPTPAESGSDTEGAGSGGDTDTDAGGPGDDPDGPFACEADGIAPSLPLRRLSKVQYENTVADLVHWAIGAEGAAVVEALGPLLARIPEDARRGPQGEVHGGFRRLDQDVHQEHINATFEVARTAARHLTTEHLTAVAGSCATDGDPSNDGTCVDDFIRRFGERALRRPLSDEEVAFHRDVFDAGGITQGMEPEAFADVITIMMTSPQFLYMMEHGEGEVPDQPTVYRLGPYELAARLSYHFWQGPPDEALIDAARSGALMTDEGYAAQVDRLFADPRTEEALREFYGEWLALEDLPALDARLGVPAYDAIVDGLPITAESTDNLIGEVLDMASYYTTQGGTFEEFFTSRQSFATTDDLAAIYGVAPWTGGEPPAFADPDRVGLISRAALVASGSLASRPIKKGVFIRKSLLCDALPPPPDNAAAAPPEVSADRTTREVVEDLTEQPGSACASCHATLINALGFATENFDALGRHRTEQVLFDEDGNITGSRPIDTSSTPRIDQSDDRVSSGPADLTRMLVESERVQSCFTRHYVRWTFGREEDPQSDGCMMNAATADLIEGVPLGTVLSSIALRPEFRTRQIVE